jgi:hypothetical protein
MSEAWIEQFAAADKSAGGRLARRRGSKRSGFSDFDERRALRRPF